MLEPLGFVFGEPVSVDQRGCWGNTDAPHVDDVPSKDIVDLVLTVRAQAYSIEAANPRHAHEWEVWHDVNDSVTTFCGGPGPGSATDPELCPHCRT